MRKPEWLKISIGANERYTETKRIVENHCLHTICSSGRCPNMGECWGKGTATFMIGGDICTRSCKFCNTQTGRPLPLDADEPTHVAESIALMKLSHAVVTSVDRDDLPDLGKENTFEQCVSEMALAGFTGSEVGNKYPKDPEVLKKALELRGVEICNQWFSSFLITKPFEEVEKEFRAQLTFLKAMGAKIIGASEQSHSVQGMQDTPIFGHKYVMNDEEWDTFCTGMNKLGKIAKEEYGISLTFHHHMGTVVQNPDEVERMMENTDPEYVSLLFDTGHFTYCGADPLEMVKKYVSRIKHVHLKDIRPEVVEKVKNENLSFLEGVRLGTFTVPGDGCIDFDPIFKVLEDAGYEGYMLVEAEQDPAKANPLEYAIKARKFIAEKTGL